MFCVNTIRVWSNTDLNNSTSLSLQKTLLLVILITLKCNFNLVCFTSYTVFYSLYFLSGFLLPWDFLWAQSTAGKSKKVKVLKSVWKLQISVNATACDNILVLLETFSVQKWRDYSTNIQWFDLQSCSWNLNDKTG